MKYTLALLLSLLVHTITTAQEQRKQYEVDFDSVFSVYDKNIEPYLKGFSENRYSDKDDVLIEATYLKYKAKLKKIELDCLSTLERLAGKSSYSKAYFLGYLDQVFEFEFPCLDKAYYTKVHLEVTEQIQRELKK